jgi:hypothetical protein
MKNKSTLKISMIAVLVMICGLLASGASAIAQSNDGISDLSQFRSRHCSDRTLYGDYGSNSQGVLLLPPGLALQFVGVTMTHFDGRGDLSWVEHTVVNGAPLSPGFTVRATGTYSVNHDCTGSATVNTPNSPVPLKLFFVIVKHGTEVRAVLDTNAISTVFTKVD